MNEEEDILKKHISADFKQDVPSVDFTQLVMEKVEQSLETRTIVAPLIPKKTWVLTIIVGLAVVLISFGIETQITKPKWLKEIGFNFPKLENYRTTIQIGIVIFIIFLLMTMADIIYRKQKQIHKS